MWIIPYHTHFSFAKPRNFLWKISPIFGIKSAGKEREIAANLGPQKFKLRNRSWAVSIAEYQLKTIPKTEKSALGKKTAAFVLKWTCLFFMWNRICFGHYV